MPNVMHSSSRMDWQTPEWFLNLVRQVGNIHLDPCCGLLNNTAASICMGPFAHLGPGADYGADALSQDWNLPSLGMERENLIYVNPPYGRSLPRWTNKITSVYGVNCLVLVPCRPETDWYDQLFNWASNVLEWRSQEFGHRIRFVDPTTGQTQDSAPFPSAVFFHSNDQYMRRRFVETFRPHGRLVKEYPSD